jgi:hypothetical protein
MEAHLVGDDIDTVSSQHVEGGVGDVYDTGYTKDKGKPNGKKGEYTPTDETANDDVENEIHILSLHRFVKISPRPSFSKRGIIPPFCKGRLGRIL